jgi:signal transduction histidine kinase
MKHLIEQMLIESKLESGNLNKEAIREKAIPSPLWAMMSGAIEQGRSFARDNSELEVRLRMKDETVQLVCDIDLMKHALSEIIANALDFSPPQEYIVIDQWISNNLVVISITDMGSGMSESATKRALMPFTQAIQVETSNKGLGLGLSLANQIIQLHGGTLDVVSTPDEGTTVIIRLPFISQINSN